MAIRIRQSPEPLSPASFELGPEGECLVISSDASRLLVEELRRYCRQEISGRSFLISGHRGAGKTTLMANAFLEVWKESQRSGWAMRPLFVPLHGPSLFPDFQSEVRQAVEETPEKPKPNSPSPAGSGASASTAGEAPTKPETPAAEKNPQNRTERSPRNLVRRRRPKRIRRLRES